MISLGILLEASWKINNIICMNLIFYNKVLTLFIIIINNLVLN
jgi:hypothetical protein